MTAHSTGLQRKITTILAADVAEYSRHMAQDEEATLRTFRSHKEIFEKLLETYGGRIFNTAGDAILAEFTSAVEAVRCATEIQAALRTRNDQLPPARQLKFRIGVNLGDVMVEGTDLLGDGVNIAARIQTSAPPGGVSISGSIYDQIRNKLSLSFRPLGEQKFKNIPEPVRTYSIVGVDAPGEQAPQPGLLSRWKWGAAAAAVVLVMCGAAAAVYLPGLLRASGPAESYAGEVCYGASPQENARCYRASGVLTGSVLKGKWPSRNQNMLVAIEGTLERTGDIALRLEFIMANNEHVPVASLKGTLKDGRLSANGEFEKGRTVSINWMRREPAAPTN